jgi:RNA polymerase sigma-70 factor (ECF subfamily)
MTGPTDQELVVGIIRKDESIVRIFVEKYQGIVYRQSYNLVGNQQDAEEACQDVFIKAFKKIESFEGRSKLSTWLYQITYTTCLDALKKRKRRRDSTDIEDIQEPAWDGIDDSMKKLEQEEQKHLINEAISKLDPLDSMLIDLYHLQEMTMKEIAEITQMTTGSVKVRILRARRKLAIYLDKAMAVNSMGL